MKKFVMLLCLVGLLTFGSAASAEEWQSLGEHSNVDIDKEWTVKFNQLASASKIDGVVVEKDAQFIPITVKMDGTASIKVSAVNGYLPNTSYTMRVFLANGKRYKMNFTTGAGYRDIDRNNDVFVGSPEIKPNEKIQASLANEKVDYFKIVLPENGHLSVRAVEQSGNTLDLALYGVNGDNESSIDYDNNASTAEVSSPLAAGTYYIRVKPTRTAEKYTLETTFKKPIVANDASGSTYIQAPVLKLNSSTTGHVGFINEKRATENADYYKIELKEYGKLTVNVTEQKGNGLDVALYGEKGDDTSSINYENNKIQAEMTEHLAPGTYYVRIKSTSVKGSEYKLTTKFEPVTVQNDQSSHVYVNAPAITLGKTVNGLLGYTNADRSANNNDFYKVNVTKKGTLTIQAKKVGGSMTVALYGEKGNDSSSLKYASNVQSTTINYDVTPGTYYVKLENISTPGSYSLSVKVN